jgi:LysM repeat protein
MNKPLQKLRRFFTRTKKLNATANPDALSAAYDDDDGASRLSGAFVVVLLLHIVALVGVFAFARIKDSRAANTPNPPPAANAAASLPALPPKGAPPKQPAVTPNPAPTVAVQPTATVPPAVNAAAVVHNDARTPLVEAPRAATTNSKGERLYLVKSGENLTKIGAMYGVTVADLVKANGLKSENDVRAGQELKIPEPSKTTAKPTDIKLRATEEKATPGTYVVRKNDSLIKIAKDLKVGYEDLVKLNNIKDPKKLQEGQKLKVPRKG